MNVTIQGLELAEDGLLRDSLRRVKRFETAVDAAIIVSPRNPSGFIQYLLYISYAGGGSITIGAIQRAEGDATEFHS